MAGAGLRILVTGAGSGIGRAVVDTFRKDAQMRGEAEPRFLLADLDPAPLEAQPHAHANVVEADLADPQTPRRLVGTMVDAFGGIDVIVSNAGALVSAPLAELSVDAYERLFAVNTRATWLLGQAAHPFMKGRGGSIVATASMSAQAPTPGLGSYSASKAALVMLVRQMAVEWGGDGIRCNCVSPGPTLTGMTKEAYDDPERRSQREAVIPMGRLGQAGDIAGAIVFLSRPEAGFINGVDLPVDGGMLNMLMKASGAGTGHRRTAD